MQSNGVSLDERTVAVQLEKEGGAQRPRGIRVVGARNAEASFESPVPIARVAKAACLSVKNVPAVASRVQRFGLEDQHEASLATAIAHEMLLGDASRWHGYLESLPVGGEPVPLLWPEELLGALEGTDIVGRVRADRDEAAAVWEQAARPLLREALGTVDGGEKGLQTFLVGLSFATSRAFMVDSEHREALVPLADLFNHKVAFAPAGASVEGEDGDSSDGDGSGGGDDDDEWEVDEDGDGDVPEGDRVGREGREMEMALSTAEGIDVLPIMAIQPVRRGEEVHNTYGEKGNAELLAAYGFAVPGNVFDQVLVGPLRRAAEALLGERRVRARCRWLEVVARPPGGGPGSDGTRAARKALNAGHFGFVLKARHSARASRGALAFAHACGLDEEDFGRANQDPGAWLSRVDEVGALRCGEAAGILLEALRARLGEYGSGGKGGCGARVHRDPGGGGGWGAVAERMSAIVVSGEKELLRRGIDRAGGGDAAALGKGPRPRGSGAR